MKIINDNNKIKVRREAGDIESLDNFDMFKDSIKEHEKIRKQLKKLK